MLSKYSVLLEYQPPTDSYLATVMDFPECKATGTSRQAALDKVQQLLEERLRGREIVTIEAESPDPGHPWARFAGMFKDDAQFNEMQAFIAADRRELDAEMAEYYRQLDEGESAA